MNFNDYSNIFDKYGNSDYVITKFGYRIPEKDLFSTGNGLYYRSGEGYTVLIYPNSMIYGL